MALGRIGKSAITATPLRYRIPVAVVGVVLSAASFGVTSASATLSGDVTGVVGSLVPPATVPVAPSPPSPPPPATPPAPTAPAVPQVPVKLPTGVMPASSPSSSPAPAPSGNTTEVPSPAADVPSVGGTTGAARKAASSVPSGETSVRQSDRGASAPTSEVGATEVDARTSGAPRRKLAAASAPPSIKTGRAAPLRRWLARVWPAIALGPDGASPAQWGDRRPEGTRPPTVFDAARLLLLGIARASGDPAPSENPARPSASPAAPNDGSLPGGREITSFVIVSFAALLALLASSVWVELRARYR